MVADLTDRFNDPKYVKSREYWKEYLDDKITEQELREKLKKLEGKDFFLPDSGKKKLEDLFDAEEMNPDD